MDNTGLFSRLKRYGHVGSQAGIVATKLAGGRLSGRPLLSEQAGKELRKALGGLKGPIMKVAQILSTVPNALPPDVAKELAELQSSAPPMGRPFVKRRMNNELGPDWMARFQNFELDSSYAASLGQVHRATSHEGDALVCKLQYPDMASVVEADLRQLKVIMAIYRRFDKAINPQNIHEELGDRLREELDYSREIKNMNLYRAMLDKENQIHVPVPFEALSTAQLLSMSYLEGQPLKQVMDWPLEMRNTVAINMFRAWYVPLYHYGVIHGDPHPGNYTVRDNGDINLLDFGCIRIFEPGFVKGIIDLYQALRDDDEAGCVAAYESWGFENISKELIAVLNKWARYVYTPLLEDRVRRIQDTDDGVYGANLAYEIHQELRRLGGIKPPREFVLVDRAAIGLGSVFMRLKCEVNWYRLFHDMVGSFDTSHVAQNQQKVLEKVGL